MDGRFPTQVLSLAAACALTVGLTASLTGSIDAGSSLASPAEPVVATDGAWWADDEAVREGLEPRFTSFTRESHYLRMRDGVQIAVEAWVPRGAAGERFPTVLEQTRYWRARHIRAPFRWLGVRDPMFDLFVEPFLARGYARVVVDVRGTGASFGSRDMEWSPAEVGDGREVVDWIVRQPWSDGQVAAVGVSYGGYAAERLLGEGHPAVKAAALLFSGYDVYTDIGFPGGLHLAWFTENWGRMNAMLDANDLSPVLDWKGRLALAGVRPVSGDRRSRLLRAAREERRENYDVHQAASAIEYRDDRTDRGWVIDDLSPFAYREAIESSGVPVYHYAGWFDGAYTRGAIHRFLTRAHPQDRLVIGPWNHGGEQNASEFSPAEDAAFPHIAELVRFLDLHLRGVDHGLAPEPPIHYFTVGEERWRSTPAWPPPGAETLILRLAAGGTLAEHEPAGESAFEVSFAAEPAPGTGSLSRWTTLMGGHVHYPDRRLAEDARMITFTSDPLERELTVTGHPLLSLFVSASGPDAAVFAYLEDVAPDGRVRYVTEGQLRAIHRDTVPAATFPYRTVAPARTYLRRDARALPSEEPAELRFDLLPLSYRFGAGHRIRISVSGGDPDHFAPVPGASDTIRIHGGGAYPSRIELPVEPLRPSPRP